MFGWSQRRTFKVFLLAGSVLISVSFLLITNYLVSELSKPELAKVVKIAKAYEQLTNPHIADYGDILKTIRENTEIPIIITDADNNILNRANIDPERAEDTAYLYNQLRLMRLFNAPIPIEYAPGSYQYVFFKEQRAITYLRIFPYVQLTLITLFLVISYVAFDTRRRYEQNQVWVGMAKETAHQIGTPLSSLIAWMELIEGNGGQVDATVAAEIRKDIRRLEVITERFSKIGSTPELEVLPMPTVVEEALGYLQKRISKKVKMELLPYPKGEYLVALNRNLFGWVIENMVKNAVDAMTGEGKITFSLHEKGRYIYLDIADTGKGIPRNMWPRIFEPGYTTRKRGWGLGLSLSRRIVRNYHRGNIWVKDSEVGKGSVFRIKLRKAADSKPK